MSTPDPLGIHASQYQNNYSEAETNQLTVEFNEITKGFAQAMAEGIHPSDAKVQELVKRHYAFVSKFWAPNKEAYKSLAMSYVLPSPYRDTYDAVAIGLGKYHYDAIIIWAELNL